MPVVLAPIAVSYIWSFIFAFNGPLNQALGVLGLDSWQRDWLADPTLAKFCVLTVMVWQNIGFVMVIYLAGLADRTGRARGGRGPGRRRHGGAASGTSSCRPSSRPSASPPRSC